MDGLGAGSGQAEQRSRQEMLGGMLNRHILTAFCVQPKFRRSWPQGGGGLQYMEDTALLFPHIQEGLAVDSSPVRALAAPFGVEDSLVQDNGNGGVRPGPYFQNFRGKGFARPVLIIKAKGFHAPSIPG
jgi:hypothetical protein